ncbi:MAG: redoxin domain-containing protein [Planctomycetia bacterium]
MRSAWLSLLLSSLVAGVLLTVDPPGETLADPPGSEPLAVERLELQSQSGERVPFADLLGTDGRAVCLAFLHPDCPLAQDYAPVLGQLATEFADKGIRFVGVVSEVDALGDIEAYRRDFKIPFPIDLDRDFRLAEALDVTVTPEVVLVDRDRRVRYSGRIDDRYKIRGVMSPGTPDPELREAIVDLVAGHTIREPRTEAVGCPIDRPERPVPDRSSSESHAVTFFHDVLPFLHGHCQQCHSPGQAGPFSLLSYDDAVDWIDVGLEEIEARRMPPAQIESDFDFSGPKAPTAAEIAMLRAWVAAGKPEGIPTDVPRLAPLPDYSAFEEDLGPPDIILEQPEPTQLGAHGNDVYRNIVFPLARPEDLRLRAIQVLPGNRKVVHHALIGHLPRETVNEAVRQHGGRDGFSHPDDSAGGFQDSHGIGFRVPPIRSDGQPRASFVGGYVPGVRAVVAPADAGVMIPAGCDITVQFHYVRTGKLETDSSRVGLWLEKQPPRDVMNMIYLSGDFAVVPPGVTDFRVTGSYTLPQDADLVGVIPHAHQLARWLAIRVDVPGEEQPRLLLRVPQWDYNWQSPYNLGKPVRFPAGTRFEAECSYDNSAANPRNPFDPPQNVWHNETTNDEMLLPMFTFASERPLDPKGDSFKKFYSTVVRSRFYRRQVDHRHKYVADAEGNIIVSPNFDPDDHHY